MTNRLISLSYPLIELKYLFADGKPPQIWGNGSAPPLRWDQSLLLLKVLARNNNLTPKKIWNLMPTYNTLPAGAKKVVDTATKQFTNPPVCAEGCRDEDEKKKPATILCDHCKLAAFCSKECDSAHRSGNTPTTERCMRVGGALL